MTINPKDAKPDQVYLVKYDKETCIGVRNNPDPDYATAWTLAALDDFVYSWDGVEDSKVSDLVPLVPARNITRDDLPAWAEVEKLVELAPWKTSTVEVVLDTVVAHLNERGGIPAEAQKKIAALRDELNQTRKAHSTSLQKLAFKAADDLDKLTAERDELQAKLDAEEQHRHKWFSQACRAEVERDELRAKLDDAKNQRDHYKERLALAPAEGWPEWLGTRPEKPNAVRNSDGVWAMDRTLIAADITPAQCDHFIAHHVNTATNYAAVKGAIESEQAATDDKDQRVEEWAREAARIMAQSACDELGQPYEVFDMLIERLMPRGRALVDAGWTPPENEEK